MITVDGKQVPWREGTTIARLLEETEGSRFCAVVRLNGKLISKPHFEKVLVPDNAEVILIPMVAGG